MKRIPLTRNVKCCHEGCNEYGHYSYQNRKEYLAHSVEASKYRCSRHSHPDEVLGLETRKLTKTLTVTQKEMGKYFDGFWGLVHGDGYKAFAKDFPVGTTLTITAEIKLPNS